MKCSSTKILVTGGTSGIGLEIVRALVKTGAKIIVISKSQEKLDLLQKQYMLEAVYSCDLSNPLEVSRVCTEVLRDHADLQVLINNAGTQQNAYLTDEVVTFESIQAEINLNFLAPIMMSKICLPLFLKQKEAAIVNITSGLALVPKTSSAVYCGTKGGLHIFSQGLRYHLEGTPVRLIEILPPVVDTAMTSGRGKNKLSPIKVADAIVKALENGPNEVYLSKTKLLLWMNRIAPPLAREIMKRFG